MKSHHHAIIGAVAAILPDTALVLFGWRKDWLPEGHLLVRSHRFLHSTKSIPVIVGLAWATHIIADRYSQHRSDPNE